MSDYPKYSGYRGSKEAPRSEDLFWDKPRPMCHENHPDLSLGGGTLVGGNCKNHDRHEGVSLYVALDAGMAHPLFEPKMPVASCVYYPITNMRSPKNPHRFEHLIDLIVQTLAAGKKVHVGCIGGHGRTGLVLAAVVSRLQAAGEENDAIGWVRQNYCKKAVESKEQEAFLVAHYGCLPQPSKTVVDKF